MDARDRLLAAISKAQSFDQFGSVIVETCAHEFQAEVCTIWRVYVDDKGAPMLRLLAASAKAPQTLAQEVTYAIRDDPSGLSAEGVTAYVAQTRREVHVSSFEQLKSQYGFCWKGQMDKSQWAGHPERHFHSLSAFPLLLGDHLVGVLKLENKANSFDGFPPTDRCAIRELAQNISLAVHAFSLLEKHEERLIQVPATLVAALLRPFDPRQQVSEIVKTVANTLHAEICSLWLLDPSSRQLRLADGFGFSTEASAEQVYYLSEPDVPDRCIKGITAWVAVRKKPFWANSWEELKAHPSWQGQWDQYIWHNRNEVFRCLYAVPLLRQESVIGVLKVENRIGAAFFTESDRALCGVMASLIVLVLDLGQQLRTSLLSDLVHLIRSPIGQVPMNLSVLEREIKAFTPTSSKSIERIESAITFIKRALLAVNVTSQTLVAFAQKPTDWVPRQDAHRLSLIMLVRERLREFEPLLYSGIRFVPHFPPDTEAFVISIDITAQTRVQIAIDNIMYNAIKYSKPDGIVHVTLHRSESAVHLTIQDEGHGISDDDLPRIFEPGFSRRAPGHPQGTGMGLTTVKQILDGLGWTIDVSSKLNIGTTFVISIPFSET